MFYKKSPDTVHAVCYLKKKSLFVKKIVRKKKCSEEKIQFLFTL